MRAKIFRVLFCISILTGAFLGSIVKEKETSETWMVITASGVRYETKEDSETEKTETEAEDFTAEPIPETEDAVAEDAMAEEPDEGMNSFGLPLLQDTVLLVTLEKHFSNTFSENYEKISAEYEYDSQGHMLRYMEDSIGRFSDKEYEYDAAGNLLQETCYTVKRKEDGELLRRQGSIVREIDYLVEYSYGTDESGQTIRTEREYDKNGRLREECVYDSEENWLKRTAYRESGLPYLAFEYDPSGRQYWAADYDDEGHVERQYRREYDEYGSVILYDTCDGEGNPILDDGDCDCGPDIFELYGRRYEYEFDEAGNVIMQTGFDENGNRTGYVENSYDERGNLIGEALYDAENTLREYEEYSYDEKGNLVWEYLYDDYEEPRKVGYEYDAAGHRTKMWIIYYDYGDVEGKGNPEEDTVYVIWEREYDDRGRLITYTDYSDKEWYNCSYRMISGSDEDYPYDRIRINVY